MPGYGTAATWQVICRGAREVSKNRPGGAQQFFEKHFIPAAISGRGGPTGLITGYYEPELRGARQRTARFNVPLHVRPPDLVTVSLGHFRDDLKGKKISGRVVQGRLVPYPDRGKIERGALKNRKLELVWVDSAADAFFLHIQGSGRIKLRDGVIMRVGYAGTNGHAYTAIGRELIARGEIPREKMSMQAIRGWLEVNPADGAELMRTNRSYVFFRELTGDGPLGAQGVKLTPKRSLAIDRRLLPLGLPVWLDTTEPDGTPFRRLMIAQDTGGAIRGAVRGDVFWGPGTKRPTTPAKCSRRADTGSSFPERSVRRAEDVKNLVCAALLFVLPGMTAGQLFTGPSRSSDIERIVTAGVHGHLRLHVLLIRQTDGEEKT